MRQKKAVSTIGGMGLLVLALAATAQTSGWSPTLLPAPQGLRKPSEPIRLRLPQLPGEVIRRLTLELDAFDVTGLAALQGNELVVTVPSPLPYGTHRLRLVEIAPDGSLIERGAWNFDVRRSASFREAGLSADTALSASYRIADRNLVEPAPDKAQYSGAAQVRGLVADGDWRVQGNIDLLYDSQGGDPGRQPRALDSGRFLVRADAGALTAAAGHQDIGPESLILAGFNRRGVSVGFVDRNAGNSATAFALHTQDVIGFQDGLGVGDSGNRVDGVVASGRPVPAWNDAVVVTATYLSGEGLDQSGTAGTGIAGDAFSSGGDAASIAVDSVLVERRLRLRGEQARTRYDLDGLDSGEPKQTGTARSGLVSYSPWSDKVVDDMPMTLQFVVDNRRISSFFRSPANPQGMADREGTRGSAQFGWGGLQLNASVGRSTDNVDDLANLERSELTERALNLGYTPTLRLPPPADPNQPPPLPWYGQPSFAANYFNVDQDIVKSSATLATGPFQSTREISTNATFTYYRWSWSFGHALGKSDNFANLADDTTTRRNQIQFNVGVSEKLNIGTLWQRAHIANRSTAGQDGDSTTAGVNLGYAFTERINASVAYNFNRETRDDNAINARTRDVAATLNWLAIPAHDTRPGLTLALDGQYHDFDDRVNLVPGRNQYQIFLKATMNWLPRL